MYLNIIGTTFAFIFIDLSATYILNVGVGIFSDVCEAFVLYDCVKRSVVFYGAVRLCGTN